MGFNKGKVGQQTGKPKLCFRNTEDPAGEMRQARSFVPARGSADADMIFGDHDLTGPGAEWHYDSTLVYTVG